VLQNYYKRRSGKDRVPQDAIECTQGMLLRMESGRERGNATQV
jgi:hypothetical protein